MQNAHYWNLTEAEERVHVVRFCQQIWTSADLDSLALSKSKFQSFKVHVLEPATVRLLHVSGKDDADRTWQWMSEGRTDASAEEQKLITNKLRNRAAGKSCCW